MAESSLRERGREAWLMQWALRQVDWMAENSLRVRGWEEGECLRLVASIPVARAR